MSDLNKDFWHDEYMEEVHDTIIASLSAKGESIVDITLTPNGLRLVEACDGHYGTTLTKAQLERFISELQELLMVMA